ncbi:hypothetical protein GJ744_008059 [Endocarpon pusillum]|uniref:Uncharacterized protein n=1 Tax=Endocarpon pusillum TaxID=364733 RepID=A0A8H7E746_9EURO|nr:hypothetical protein GJ744_008059 [Endocarpon pusillum]
MEELETICRIWKDANIGRQQTGVAEGGIDPGSDTAQRDIARSDIVGPDVTKPPNDYERRKSAMEQPLRYLQEARAGTINPKCQPSTINLEYACVMLQDQQKADRVFKWEYRDKADVSMKLFAHQVIGAAWMGPQ